MFKKPLKAEITVTHEIRDEDKDFLDRKVDELKRIVREGFIILAVGIPLAFLAGFAGAAIAEHAQNTTPPVQ